jgi:hypothetical protein
MVSLLYAMWDDGAHVEIDVSGWPENAIGSAPESVFGDYWPPRGARVVEEVAGEPAKRFTVDVGSEASLLRFESDFGLYTAERLQGVVAIHAALIECGDALIILPGESHRGKSTLAATAHQHGLNVLSDEYCLVHTDTGEVSGWRRPMRKRLPHGAVERIPLTGVASVATPTHVMGITFDSAPDAPILDLQPMSAGEVAMELLANTVCAQSRPQESFQAAVGVARVATGFVGKRGEAQAALGEILSLIGVSEERPATGI